jgi:hypothetical protein
LEASGVLTYAFSLLVAPWAVSGPAIQIGWGGEQALIGFLVIMEDSVMVYFEFRLENAIRDEKPIPPCGNFRDTIPI